MPQELKRPRKWTKCSKCREKKIKCEPEDRDWDTKNEKCNYCAERKLPCGPNVTKYDDPEAGSSARAGPAFPANNDTGREGSHQQDAQSATVVLNTSFSPGHTRPEQGQQVNESRLANVTSPKDRRVRIHGLTDNDLRAKALEKLERLNILGTALVYKHRLCPVLCPGFGGYEEFNNVADTISDVIGRESHSLFIYIYDLASEADARVQQGLAREILLRLLLALERYPGLGDSKKCGVLLKIALFFQRSNDQCEFEYVLVKVANLHQTATLPLHPEPYSLLAESLWKTSEKAREVLATLWQEHLGIDVPENLAIPCLQRAAQQPNVNIALAVLSRSETVRHAPAMLNQQALHIAATSGYIHTLDNLINRGAIIDARDLHSRTPLFLAAENGHEQCCANLLARGANPNNRDAHGHSIMEVAARKGSLPITQLLLAWGAHVNPILGHCASTPLQAAVESSNFSYDLIQYLVDANADVSNQRVGDGKNAIDLAEGRGLTILADSLRQKQMQQTAQSIADPLSPGGQSSPLAQPSPFGVDFWSLSDY